MASSTMMPETSTNENRVNSLKLYPITCINNMVNRNENGMPMLIRPALRKPMKYQEINATKNMPTTKFHPSVDNPSLMRVEESWVSVISRPSLSIKGWNFFNTSRTAARIAKALPSGVFITCSAIAFLPLIDEITLGLR